MLLRDFQVLPLLDTGKKNEGKGRDEKEWEREVMQATMGITMGIRDVPVRFVRRGARA